jgi:transcriptional regulator with XRE-family HTH domain
LPFIYSHYHQAVPNSLFAKNLKFLRKMRGLSQQKLAVQIGLKRNNIASYEAGVVEPRSVNFIKLVRFFEVPPHDLLEKDLATVFAREGHGNQTPQAKALSKALDEFAHGTEDLQKVLEGFREFYRLRQMNSLPVQQQEEIDNSLEIMEQLLSANWALLQELAAEEE